MSSNQKAFDAFHEGWKKGVEQGWADKSEEIAELHKEIERLRARLKRYEPNVDVAEP